MCDCRRPRQCGSSLRFEFRRADYFRDFCCIFTKQDSISEKPIANGVWPRSEVRDGDLIFFVEYNTKNLYRLNLTGGGAPAALMSGNAFEGVVFTNSNNVFLGTPGLVRKTSKAGGAITDIKIGTAGTLRGADDVYIYYSTDDGKLWALKIDGNAPVSLLASAVLPLGRVLSKSGYIYWLDGASGTSSAKLLRLKIG